MLKQAIKLGDTELFEYMIDKDERMADESFGKTLNRPLHIACEYGRLEFVRRLIVRYKAEVNSVCPLTGFTPLMYAVQAGQYDVVKYLCS